jgi:tetratricopeptide (TPR) repeat protein
VTPEEFDASVLYNKARELAESGNTGAAVHAYDELCTQFPGDPRFFIAFGQLLQSLGHWEQSIEKFLKGLELRPHYCEGDARLMLADSYFKAGHKAKAVEQWRQVAQMPPEYPSYDAVPNEAKRRLREHAA